ncbi:hypothetical protein N7448_010142 [Penicillium atrosanguineum]|uniref:Uncharacterized protein n=1 Tax=Penicillium atrosanguineum TaxID=1132637 RepID=A0A9W9TZW6_9EURO|nr:uncharacterized protein N7443_007364 [Penicillium atrosanguineum]KAJ5118435.1 hypothetical protein N7526_010072 [Penicillium atrosanguineum]KAJ5119473.1 hypothetical protein N7448_010142 [Penicillium atrosanguineum]KAJ5296471.1 hypothetical protein N7443_007364 [Penicillium atrosanguineum]KAJ5299239.1 hypothetical protein N7476_010796 [Penicillium atrosanguineum]
MSYEAVHIKGMRYTGRTGCEEAQAMTAQWRTICPTPNLGPEPLVAEVGVGIGVPCIVIVIESKLCVKVRVGKSREPWLPQGPAIGPTKGRPPYMAGGSARYKVLPFLV